MAGVGTGWALKIPPTQMILGFWDSLMLLLCPQVSSSGAGKGRTRVKTLGKIAPAPSWGGCLAPAKISSLQAQIYLWLVKWESSGCYSSPSGKRLLSHSGGSKDLLLSPLCNPHSGNIPEASTQSLTLFIILALNNGALNNGWTSEYSADFWEASDS